MLFNWNKMEMFIGCLPDRIELGKYIATLKYFGKRKFSGETFTVTRYLQEDINSNNHDINTSISIANRGLETISEEEFSDPQGLFNRAFQVGIETLPDCPTEMKQYIRRISDRLTLSKQLKVVG